MRIRTRTITMQLAPSELAILNLAAKLNDSQTVTWLRKIALDAAKSTIQNFSADSSIDISKELAEINDSMKETISEIVVQKLSIFDTGLFATDETKQDSEEKENTGGLHKDAE